MREAIQSAIVLRPVLNSKHGEKLAKKNRELSKRKVAAFSGRKGQQYFLHQGMTKTGKPRFFASRKSEGALSEMPQGYEFSESINGIVSIQKTVKAIIPDRDVERVKAKVTSYAHLTRYKVEAKRNQIIVFQPDSLHAIEDLKKSEQFSAAGFLKTLAENLGQDSKKVIERAANEMGMSGVDFLKLDAVIAEEKKRKAVACFYDNLQYSAVFRFTLNVKLGTYLLERRCYRGDREWIFLYDGSLALLVNKYIRHLGKESFYELM